MAFMLSLPFKKRVRLGMRRIFISLGDVKPSLGSGWYPSVSVSE